MKAVLISINPQWCELIAQGKKTVEVRKTKSKIDVPFKCYIYCTSNKDGTKDLLEIHNSFGKIHKANSKVIGEFVCDRIDEIGYSPEMHGQYISNIENLYEVSCVNFEEMFDYIADGFGYGWHISNLVIYDKPKDLKGFRNPTSTYKGNIVPGRFLSRPPQSWQYVEELGVK